MNTVPKENREPAALYDAETKCFEDNFSALYTAGIDRVGEELPEAHRGRLWQLL